MTIKRYRLNHAGIHDREEPLMIESEHGDWVSYDVARRDIERLGNELFAARAELAALYKQRETDIAVLNARIDAQNEQKRQAAIALGFADPDEFRT